MKQQKMIVLMVLVFSLILAACGGGGEEPAVESGGDEVTVSTTETTDNEANTETTEENSSDETAVSLDEEVRAEEGGFAFQPPAGYDVGIDYIFAELSGLNLAADTNHQLFQDRRARQQYLFL